MNKRSAFYVLLAAVLLIVILKTSVMGERNEKKSALLEKGAIETIMGRKSVRKYLNKPVEEEKITTLLKAGMAAPSGKDTRPWAFVVVTKRAALDSMAAGLPYAKMLIQAPLAIVVCGDPSVSSYWCLIVRQPPKIYYWQPKHWNWGLSGQQPIRTKTGWMWYADIANCLKIWSRSVLFRSAIPTVRKK